MERKWMNEKERSYKGQRSWGEGVTSGTRVGKEMDRDI